MKVVFNDVYDREETKREINIERRGSKKHVRIEQLSKIYESPKAFLRRSLDVIEMAVQDQLETMFNNYVDWRRGKAKRPEYIFNMIQDISFVSILPKIVKNNYDFILERGEEFSEIISTAVTELTRKHLAKSKEMISIYSRLYEDLNEERIRKISKLELGPEFKWDDALRLCIVSHGTPKHTMINTLRAIYNIATTTDYKILRKLFRRLYGKEDMGRVSIYILLEKTLDTQRNKWINREQHSVITNIALDELNKLPKDEIKELLKLYCEERRRSEFDQFTHRRIKFSAINKDDYGKIDKVVKKLVKKNEMYRTFLDHSRVFK